MNFPEPNEDHRQVMPQTVEAYKKLAQRDLELIEEQREEISKLKQKVNKLEQKLNKIKVQDNEIDSLLRQLEKKQYKRLPTEFEQVLYDNLDDLYDSEP